MIAVFEKSERLRHIGHLDIQRAVMRALRRSGLPVSYSKGFNPHILLTFASALSTGAAGRKEIMDVQLDREVSPEEFVSAMNAAMPPDMQLSFAKVIDDRHVALMAQVQAADYTITILDDVAGEKMVAALPAFLTQESIITMRKTKSGMKETDIRPLIHTLTVEGCAIHAVMTLTERLACKPGMLLEAGWGERGTIIVVQPRRLAARLLAGYGARQFPCRLGQEVGYTVRFDSQRSAATRILFVTDGILERRLTEDPELRGVSAVIFDEVHERRLSGDLCLARVLELQRGARPDIGVFVMSATLELDKLQGYLPQATVLRAEGRLYPVQVSYMPPVPVRNKFGYVQPPPVWEQCAAAVRQLVEQPESGDVLVFLPGAYEIRRTVEMLEQVGWMRGRDVFALHGQLTPEAQARAVECGSRPRVIVSTNIAETSPSKACALWWTAAPPAKPAGTRSAASPLCMWCPSPRLRPSSAPAAPADWDRAAASACGARRSTAAARPSPRRKYTGPIFRRHS